MNNEFIQMIKGILRDYPVLTTEEERNLLIEYKNNPSEELKGKIALHNVSYVLKIANRYIKTGKSYDIEDLFSEGMLGLLMGIDKFDVSKNTKLNTYATYWIRLGIERFIYNKGDIIHLPEHLHVDYARLTKEKEKLIVKEERERFLSSNEISKMFPELTAEKAVSLAEMQYPKIVSLNIHVGENSETEYGSFIEDVSADDPEAKAISSSLKENICHAMDNVLTDREKLIIMRRMGFGEYKVETLESISGDLHITKERVRQIESKALKKLRRNRRIREIGSANAIGYNVFS